jgi:hypothetical protein
MAGFGISPAGISPAGGAPRKNLMEISITLNAKAKLYEVRAEGMFAFYNAITEHEAWVGMAALAWQKSYYPEASIVTGPGVPATVLPAGRMLIEMLAANGVEIPAFVQTVFQVRDVNPDA